MTQFTSNSNSTPINPFTESDQTIAQLRTQLIDRVEAYRLDKDFNISYAGLQFIYNFSEWKIEEREDVDRINHIFDCYQAFNENQQHPLDEDFVTDMKTLISQLIKAYEHSFQMWADPQYQEAADAYLEEQDRINEEMNFDADTYAKFYFLSDEDQARYIAEFGDEFKIDIERLEPNWLEKMSHEELNPDDEDDEFWLEHGIVMGGFIKSIMRDEEE